MKNIKTTLIFASVTVFIVLGTLVPIKPTCACVSQEELVLGSVSQVEVAIDLYYEQQGRYPSLEILKQILRGVMVNPVAWVSDPDNYGIYYLVTEDGSDYRLRAYSERETLFGFTGLVKVYDGTKIN